MKYIDTETIEEHNRNLFAEFRELNLPLGEYAIVSGGPLAVRGLKKTGDVDVLVSDKLWEELKSKNMVKNIEGGNAQVISLDEDVDILSFRESSDEGIDGNPTNNEQIKNAEIIDGLSFQSLRDSLWFKHHSEREKDKKDIEIVKQYLAGHPEEAKKIDFLN